MHCQRAVPECLRVASMGGTESMMLSDTLSAGAESAERIILSAPHAESMILSALFGCVFI
jgi:hypothetical protein